MFRKIDRTNTFNDVLKQIIEQIQTGELKPGDALPAERILAEQAANVYIQDLADFVAVNKNLTGYQFYPLYVIDLSNIAYVG